MASEIMLEVSSVLHEQVESMSRRLGQKAVEVTLLKVELTKMKKALKAIDGYNETVMSHREHPPMSTLEEIGYIENVFLAAKEVHQAGMTLGDAGEGLYFSVEEFDQLLKYVDDEAGIATLTCMVDKKSEYTKATLEALARLFNELDSPKSK